MIRCAVIAAVLIAIVAFSATSVQAASSVYHSAPENVFGWCAGYSDQQAHRCAEAECRKQGGSQCRFAVGCRNYGAAAFAERPPRGFGAACLESQESARRVALVGCMSASNTVCWTRVAYLPNGRRTSPEANLRFDQVWFAQLILQSLRLYVGATDGVFDERTRAAIVAFQERIGREGNGVLDAELMQRLFDAIGGPSNLARIVRRDLLPKFERQLDESGVRNRLYYTSLEPSRSSGFLQDFVGRDEQARNLALATYLSARNSKCTLPAKSASRMVDSVWAVTCAEGTYTIIGGDGSTVITGGRREQGR